MHDAIELERRGVPTVTVTHANFEVAARTQARTMGLPDLGLAVTPRPQPSWNEATKAATLETLFDAVVAGLSIPTAPQQR